MLKILRHDKENIPQEMTAAPQKNKTRFGFLDFFGNIIFFERAKWKFMPHPLT